MRGLGLHVFVCWVVRDTQCDFLKSTSPIPRNLALMFSSCAKCHLKVKVKFQGHLFLAQPIHHGDKTKTRQCLKYSQLQWLCFESFNLCAPLRFVCIVVHLVRSLRRVWRKFMLWAFSTWMNEWTNKQTQAITIPTSVARYHWFCATVSTVENTAVLGSTVVIINSRQGLWFTTAADVMTSVHTFGIHYTTKQHKISKYSM